MTDHISSKADVDETVAVAEDSHDEQLDWSAPEIGATASFAVCREPGDPSGETPRLFYSEALAREFMAQAAGPQYVKVEDYGGLKPITYYDQGWRMLLPIEYLNQIGDAASVPLDGFCTKERISKAAMARQISRKELLNEVFGSDGDKFDAPGYPTPVCVLGNGWPITEVLSDARRAWRKHLDGSQHKEIAPIAVEIAGDAERALRKRLGNMATRVAMSQFWHSWQIWDYLLRFCEQVAKSDAGIEICGSRAVAESSAMAARDFMRVHLQDFSIELLERAKVEAESVRQLKRTCSEEGQAIDDYYASSSASSVINCLEGPDDPAIEPAAERLGLRRRGTRGPRPGLEVAERINRIVQAEARGLPWKYKLMAICSRIDAEGDIKPTKTWDKVHGCSTWEDAAESIPEHVKKRLGREIEKAAGKTPAKLRQNSGR